MIIRAPDPARSLTDKLFWPIVGIASASLVALVALFCSMTAKGSAAKPDNPPARSSVAPVPAPVSAKLASENQKPDASGVIAGWLLLYRSWARQCKGAVSC